MSPLYDRNTRGCLQCGVRYLEYCGNRLATVPPKADRGGICLSSTALAPTARDRDAVSQAQAVEVS